MPEFYKISFDGDELEALKNACTLQSEDEERMLDEAAGGDLDSVVSQEVVADDLLLIKSTVSIFRPGQTILITKEDLDLMQKNLEKYKEKAPVRQMKAIDSAMGKIINPEPAP
jgi:hypothetical protein